MILTSLSKNSNFLGAFPGLPSYLLVIVVSIPAATHTSQQLVMDSEINDDLMN